MLYFIEKLHNLDFYVEFITEGNIVKNQLFDSETFSMYVWCLPNLSLSLQLKLNEQDDFVRANLW